MEAYQVMRHDGLGVMEAPTHTSGTEFIFANKEDADKKADELWKYYTSESERKSGWCGLNFSVKKIDIK